MFRATSENEVDISRLVERLRAVPIGGTATHAELSAAIGRDIRPRRYLLMRALQRLNAEFGLVFESVRSLGYKRLPIDAVHTVGHRARRAIRRKAGTASKRMASALNKTNDAPPGTVLQVNRELSVLGLVRTMARDPIAGKAAEDATETAPAPIAMVAARLVKALA